MPKKGHIHIYTGEGKGKTSAAVGLAVRAKSRGLKVLFIQFMKQAKKGGETELLKKLSIDVKVFDAVVSPLFSPQVDRSKLKKNTAEAISRLKNIMHEKNYDLIILDEFNCLLNEGILTDKAACDFISGVPENIEVALTGRGATKRLIDCADYVTRMEMLKHPFNRGTGARKGIEY